MKMKMSDEYINERLNTAQKLLWGGSETENIAAHNIISKLIKDRMQHSQPGAELPGYDHN